MSQTELERAVAEVLVDEESLRNRVAELGEEISTDYTGRDLLLVGVLKGAVFFMADLMRQLTVPCEVDFMAISSYGAASDSSGVVRILKDLDIPIENRHVLVVEPRSAAGHRLWQLQRADRLLAILAEQQPERPAGRQGQLRERRRGVRATAADGVGPFGRRAGLQAQYRRPLQQVRTTGSVREVVLRRQ